MDASEPVINGRSRRGRSYCALVALCSLWWGTLAFGGVYPWAYWPLLAACTTSGILGFARAAAWRRLYSPLDLSCLLLVAAVAAQLLPLNKAVLSTLSPTAVVVIEQRHVMEPSDVEEAVSSVESLDLVHALSTNAVATMRGLIFLTVFSLFLLGLLRAGTREDTHHLVRGILVLSVTLALIGMAQRTSATNNIYGLWQPYYQAQSFGPFINRNHFAGWMIMTIPLAMGYCWGRFANSFAFVGTTARARVVWLASPEANRLILIAFGLMLMTLSLVLTLSRSGTLGVAAAVLVVGSSVGTTARGRVRRALAAFAITCIVTLGAGWTGVDALFDRFALPNSATLNGRLDIWRHTARMIEAFPLVGSGLNTYGTASTVYQAPNPLYTVVEAHNDYLQLVAEGGLLLAAPAAILLAVFVRDARNRLNEEVIGSEDYWIRIGALTGLLAIALQEFVEFSLQIPANAALFVVLCSIAVRPSAIAHPSRIGHSTSG